jgi:hypothetical protein
MGHHYVHVLLIFMKKILFIALCILTSALCSNVMAAPAVKPKAKKAAAAKPATTTAKPATTAPKAEETTHAPAPEATAPANAAVKQVKEGELEATSTGVNKQKMTVGKLDPPAAFNLEDIQNFPEDRLHPVLNNPITFEEGRDFSSMMDAQDQKVVHPWLPEIARTPFLTMKTSIDKPAKDWTFAVIDQGGTPVSTQDGTGSPPALFSWSGDDKVRGHVAIDTVYIPQLATTDKEGYRHTYMGQPMQFATLLLNDKGRKVIEMSSKRLFLEKKSDLSKEAPVFLDKVCDLIREDARLPFAIQAYDVDTELANSRTTVLVKYFSEKLYIPDSQITVVGPASSEKRGSAIAVTLNGTPGGAE